MPCTANDETDGQRPMSNHRYEKTVCRSGLDVRPQTISYIEYI